MTTQQISKAASFGNVSISRLMAGFGALVIIGLVAVASANQYALYDLKVGGARYNNIIAGKDVVADIMPPPLYVVEAYLEAQVLMDNPDEIGSRKLNILRMKRDYDAQWSKWNGSSLPDNVRIKLTEEANAEAQKFWLELNQTFLPSVAAQNLLAARGSLEILGQHFRSHRAVIVQVVEKANAYLAKTEADASSAGSMLGIVSMSVVFLMFGLVGYFLFAMKSAVSRPLKEIADRMTQISNGAYDVDIPYQNSSNEIGQIARALGVFRDLEAEKNRLEEEAEAKAKEREEERARDQRSSEQAVNSIADGLSRLAQGDLTARVNDDLPAAYGKLKEDFNNALASLEDALSAVMSNANGISSGTDEIAQASDDLSRRTEHQAATLEETAAAVAEITSNVGKSAEGADRARKVVSDSKNEAEKGGSVVSQAIDAMEGIEKSSKEIGDIISVIDEIAFQTNLLALNAGVEAARAGEAGRGFAVVASEVRALAQRSASAARQIKDLISTSTTQVDQGVELVRETGIALEQIMAGVNEINSVVSEIAAGAQEQAGGLQEVNEAVNQLDQVTQENAAMVEEATAATRTLAAQTQDLSKLVTRFKTNKVVRAAAAPSSAPARSSATPAAPIKVSKSAPKPAPSAPARNGNGAHVAAAAMAAKGNGKAAPATFSSGADDAGWEEF